MIFRLIVAASLIFPIIGCLLLELGIWGQGINQYGTPNGATLAMLAYAAVFLSSTATLERLQMFCWIGAGQVLPLPDPDRTVIRCTIVLLPMTVYVLFGLGGFRAIIEGMGAGEFRTGLGVGGSLGYLILKFYAPSLFSTTVLSMFAAGRSSPYAVIAFVLLALTSISFGYKSAIIMALLPTVVVLFWDARVRTVAYLLVAMLVALIIAYWFVKSDDQVNISLFAAIAYRAFVLNAEGAWKIWDIYISGGELPSYINTLPPVFGDRIYSAITGVTRANADAWVMSHFSLLATHLAGYEPEYLIATGHNNSAGAMAEGIIAGGIVGMLAFAAIAAAITNALYHFIENRLKARDFATASIAACYFVYCLISWLIGGGIVEIVHLSILIGVSTSFLLLRWATGSGSSFRFRG